MCGQMLDQKPTTTFVAVAMVPSYSRELSGDRQWQLLGDIANTAQELITFPKPRLPKDIEQKLRMPAAE